MAPSPGDTLLARFVERATRADSVVHRLDGWSGVAALARELAGDGSVAVAPTLAADEGTALVAALAGRATVPDPGGPATAVADVPVGVVRGCLALAETGSVLVSESAIGDRAVSMLARTLVQVVREAEVVAGLDEAGAWLARERPAYAVLSTGPSRTADIERSLTIGVQGPAAVHVAVIP